MRRFCSTEAVYNRGVLKRIFTIFAVILLGSAAVWAQVRTTVTGTGQTIVVLPFENESKAPGLEWIGESFPEVLGQRLANAALYVVSRDDRAYAFDRSGIPANVHLSRETLFRIAEQMDADLVVMGSYTYDGQTFSTVAQVLDMKHLRLSKEMKEQGTLVKIIEIQNGLAWDVLHQIKPEAAGPREPFLAAAPAIRLDAFENYIRGVVATDRPDKIKRFREAIRLNPDYVMAMLALGRTYFDGRDYEQAMTWLAKVPHNGPAAHEASFYLGLAAYYQGDWERADSAFSYLVSRMPLTEVYNNLGVVAGRRGKRTALDYFHKAVDADPSDADYRFNLAVSLYKAGDSPAAARQLRESLTLKPGDTEAKSLLESIAANGSARLNQASTNNVRVPLERIKRNYDETSLQQLALEIENAAETRLANTDPRTHAVFHVDRGRELLGQGFNAEAARNFREAVQLDPTNATAHAGLARVLESDNDTAGARAEAEAAVRLAPSADAYLVLARMELKANQADAAEHHVDLALVLEPKNSAALALKNQLRMKKSE
jgi:tetratricopeptide (TPR) repeat protein